MARELRRKCKCCLKLFVPTRVTAGTSATARLPAADEPVRLRAKPAGSPGRRTSTTAADPLSTQPENPRRRCVFWPSSIPISTVAVINLCAVALLRKLRGPRQRPIWRAKPSIQPALPASYHNRRTFTRICQTARPAICSPP
jgi:hypothetical protein